MFAHKSPPVSFTSVLFSLCPAAPPPLSFLSVSCPSSSSSSSFSSSSSSFPPRPLSSHQPATLTANLYVVRLLILESTKGKLEKMEGEWTDGSICRLSTFIPTTITSTVTTITTTGHHPHHHHHQYHRPCHHRRHRCSHRRPRQVSTVCDAVTKNYRTKYCEFSDRNSPGERDGMARSSGNIT
ncbi:hypothetical protein E2C01_091014 [Portunus trituberculatus]|uniref:Uncharacterized protein n=1 Tax=Portunus trituberculatus TaxID=210409 RepID=A0A5B7JRW1_PORTR|nr:hypothetical protein [Portunus trituberculatus]